MIYLFAPDSTIPSLPAMRMSSYFKQRGETVRLVGKPFRRELWDPPGACYGSSIFKFAERVRERIEREWGAVRWGGTGVRDESSLDEIDSGVDWEAMPLDWSLYPDDVRSIGFTQRGCRLRCKFCVVPKKEGKARSVHTIAEIYRGAPHARKILLLDNDFFGQPRDQWMARVDELIAGDFRVCFSQGINIRMIDDEAAAALARLEYRDNKFRERRLYTAWDRLGDEGIFKTGVEALRRAGVPPKHLMVYMLIGFAPGETTAEIEYRFREMVALGCEPYPMVYDRSRKDLRAFQRWAIRGLYRAFPFSEYDVTIKRPRRLPVIS
jgi:hypothetical protein